MHCMFRKCDMFKVLLKVMFKYNQESCIFLSFFKKIASVQEMFLIPLM